MESYKKISINLIILIGIILLITMSFNATFAATKNIDNTTAGGINGAITNSSTQPGDTILLDQGNYTGTNNTGITINKNITLQGNGPTDTVIIDAQNLRRIFTINNNLNVTFINVTFINGNAGSGGAIYNDFAGTTMTFINCTFSNNIAHATTSFGGAIWNRGANLNVTNSTFINNSLIENIFNLSGMNGSAIWNSGVNFTVTDSTFINNSITISNGALISGGAIWNSGANFTVVNSNFTNNYVSSAGQNHMGGAIYNTGTNFTVANSTFSGNSAFRGGAIYNTGINFNVANSNFTSNRAPAAGAIYNTGINFNVANSTFTRNTANWNSNLGGAAIWNSGANFTVVNSNFTNNSASGIGASGGAIWNNGGNFTVINSTFTGNSATYNNNHQTTNNGGAIYNNGANFSVTNSTFSGNSAYARLSVHPHSGGHGGAIYNGGSNFAVTNSTFSGNSAFRGGAIYNGGSSTNSNVTNNTFGNNNAFSNGGAIFNNGNMSVSANNMTGNTANTLGNVIYNNGTMGILNLTYLDNSTINVLNNTLITLFATLTDDMGNPITWGNITFYVNGTYIGNVTSIEGMVNITYTTNIVGIVPVNGIYTGSGEYPIIRLDGELNITKIITNSTVVAPNGKIGQNTTITGVAIDENGNLIADTQITVTINGQSYTVTTDSTGAWSLNITPDTSGNLNVVVTWAGNSTHEGFTNSTIFFVANLSTNSTITVVNSTVGKSTTINGTATDENGNVLANVQLAVTVNGTSYTVTTNAVGAWSLNVTPNTSGNLNVVVTWAGNGTHNGFTNSTTFTVAKANVNSTVVAPNGKVGQQSTLSGVATDENGNVLANVQLAVTVNGTSYTITTNSAGAWSLNVTPNTSGNLNVVVAWAGNSTHEGFTNSTTFTVAKASANSTVVAPNGKVGQTTTITGVAKDENGNLIANTQIQITVNGQTYNVTTNSAGAWSLNVTPNTAGNLNILVSWAGNSTHENFTNTTTFNVAQANTNSTINVPNTNAGQPMNITGVALDENGNPLANVNLTIVLDGTSYNVTTDNTGAWILTYTPMHEGLFDLSVSWTGNSTHLGFTNTTEFSVPKVPANTTINAPDTKAKKAINITGVATDDIGNLLANANLTVTIDGVSYNVTTDNNGRWTLTYTPTHAGVFNVTVNYAGNNTHLSFTNTTSFNVEKLATKTNITVSGDLKVGKSINITGVVTDEFGDPVANVTINVTIGGQTFTTTTNNVGAWNLTYTPKTSGNFNVSVTWSGNENYFGFTNGTSFNVVSGVKPTKLQINVPSKVIVEDTFKITSVLTDENGNPIANATIDFYVNGKYIGSAKTDKNGIAKINYEFTKAGNYKITAKYLGNESYLPSDASATTKASKIKTTIDIKVENDTVTVTLTDKYGRVLAYKNIVVRIGDKVIYGVTDENGQFVFTFKNADRYSISVTFAGNNRYYESSAKYTPKPSNNPAASTTAMKDTGIPIIAILLALLSTLGVAIGRKQN